MVKKSEIVNKTVAGVTEPVTVSGVANSETDSETQKALQEVNNRLKQRKIKGKLVIARNSLFIRGTYKDSNGINKERKIPTRLSADINNLASAEARILLLIEYVNKNGFIPDQLMWDAPKVELNGARGLTVGEAAKKYEIEYWKEEKDPIKRYIGKLIESGVTEAKLKEIDEGVKELIRDSVKKALDSPMSPVTNLEEDSYA